MPSTPSHTERLLGDGSPTHPVRRTSLGQEQEHAVTEQGSRESS